MDLEIKTFSLPGLFIALMVLFYPASDVMSDFYLVQDTTFWFLDGLLLFYGSNFLFMREFVFSFCFVVGRTIRRIMSHLINI